MSGLESNSFKARFPLKQEDGGKNIFPVESEPDQPVEAGNDPVFEHWLQTKVIEGDANATICFQNALVLIENDEYELAKGLLGAVVNRHCRCPQAIYWLGHCFNKLGQLERALFCYRALRRERDDEYSNFHLADIHYRLGNDEQAYAHYMRTLHLADFADELLFEVYKNTGNIMMRAGDIEGAVESYNKALRLCPESDVLAVNLGTACLQSEDLNQAIEYFRQAVHLNPSSDRAWIGLAMVHRTMYDNELSWANLQRALECNPQNRTAVLLAVEWAKRDGRLASTLPILQAYLEENEMDEHLILLHSQILYSVGRLGEARWEVERAMAIEPTVRGGSVLLEMIRREAANG